MTPETRKATLDKFTRILDLVDQMEPAMVDHPDRDFYESVVGQLTTSACISQRQLQSLQQIISMRDKLPGNFAATYMMLQFAAQNLDKPRMVFNITKELRVIITLDRKSGYGEVFSTGQPTGYVLWTRIRADGEVYCSAHAVARPEWPLVLEFLKQLSLDPIQAAKTSAAISGRCTYCWAELTDRRSKHAGYGPVCATRWNLPWGDAPDIDLATLF